MMDLDWMDDAQCRGVDPGTTVFGSKWQQLRAQREMCAVCPVQEICLWHAMVFEGTEEAGLDRYYTYGGLFGSGREQLAKAVGPAECAERLRGALSRHAGRSERRAA